MFDQSKTQQNRTNSPSKKINAEDFFGSFMPPELVQIAAHQAQPEGDSTPKQRPGVVTKFKLALMQIIKYVCKPFVRKDLGRN